jgi:cytidyltransferase-like protein
MNKIVLVTGGFDPLHSGHIAYFKAAKKLGDILCVGINSDAWLCRKKGRPFMHFEERKAIVENIKCVENAFSFNDEDGSAIKAIEHIKSAFTGDFQVIFANGGDRTKDNIPEMVFSDVEFVFGVGGEDKKNSSSWILSNWEKPLTQREWGSYKVLDRNDNWQTKELSFDTGKSLSDQRHFHRSEHWCVVDGEIRIDLEWPDGLKEVRLLSNGESIDIPLNVWHKATNVGNKPAKVIEVWMGNHLTEEDIERRN